jgi:hypothetical protein
VRTGTPGVTTSNRSYPTVRLQVLEAFLGVKTGEELEIRITSDVFFDGIPLNTPPFLPGESWIVEAYRDQSDQRWTTGYSQRTKPAAQAADDLRVLRAWASGKQLPARVAGAVYKPDEKRGVSGINIYLTGDRQALSMPTDARGEFDFEGVEPGMYEISGALPGGAGAPVKIDLIRAWCRYFVFLAK